MLPRAQTACSRTSSLGDASRDTKMGTAPASITTFVWSEVPEATLVSAHAASNCSCGASGFCRNSTNLGTTCVLMTSSMGGLRSMDNSFLNFWVASYCSWTLLLNTPRTIMGTSSSRCAPVPGLLLSSRAYWGAANVWRFFSRFSSRFVLRSSITLSSRFLRASSKSMPFFSAFLRLSILCACTGQSTTQNRFNLVLQVF
mmetsp:Transcript_22697/g.62659  ORF Transcript_22697/g.62659 Transcript_22697/m.62659 type:complete len:200 (-) Transcript_22697:88-687(-)